MIKMLIAVVVVVMLCLPAFSEGNTDVDLNVSVGMFFSADEYADNGVALNIERKLSSSAETSLYASIGYLTMTESVPGFALVDRETDINVIPVMLTVRRDSILGDTGDRKAYYGVGVGLALTDLDWKNFFLVGGDDRTSFTDFAWQLVGGMTLGRNVFAEAKYLNGGRDYNTGFSLSIGSRF